MATTSTSKGRILLADDEPTFKLATADLLRREGYECQTVPDGLAAAAELNTGQQYDLLIADIRMPGNEALELIRHLSQIAEGLPVILVTAYPDAATALRSADLPVLSYLIKPVNFAQLLQLVARAIGQSAVYRANKEITQRLTNWAGDAKTINDLLAKGVLAAEIRPESFVNLSIRNLLGCLSELDAMWQRLAPDDYPKRLAEAFRSAMSVFESTAAGFQQQRRDQ